jgi:signal transduction histidine kinase
MEEVAARLLRSICRIGSSGEGEVTMTGVEGGHLVGRLEPPLEEVLRRAAAEEQPVGATLVRRNGEARRIAVWPLGGSDAVVAIETSSAQEHLDLVVEGLVNEVAHDVRNLAFAIGLQAELAERRSVPPEVKGHLATVLRQVALLKAYLDRLLLYGRRPRLTTSRCDVARLVHRWVAEFSFSRKEVNPPLDIRVATAEDSGEACWDGTMLGKAFAELLDNAVRSCEPSPPVTITTSGGPTEVCIEIRDGGTGIPEEILSRLATPMRARRPGGTGLGVAIARKLARAHGGTLHLRTGAGGTAAILGLPREALAD